MNNYKTQRDFSDGKRSLEKDNKEKDYLLWDKDSSSTIGIKDFQNSY